MNPTDNPILGERFEEALQFAARLHQSQTRKTNDFPYISHLMAVSALVIQDGGSEDEAIAALLHDAAEDQGGEETLTMINALFGEVVAEIVAACSDTLEEPKPPWRERKEKYIEHIRHASPSVHRVALADKLHNARSILRDLREMGSALWGNFNGGKAGTLWYYRTLYEILAESNQGYLIEELGRVIDQIEELAKG